MIDGEVRIGNVSYVPLRTAKAITGYGASNIHRLYKGGQIRRVKRGATHVYRLEDLTKLLEEAVRSEGIDNDDDEI